MEDEIIRRGDTPAQIPTLFDLIAERFHLIHSRYVEDVNRLIKEAGGKEYMQVVVGNGGFRDVKLSFIHPSD